MLLAPPTGTNAELHYSCFFHPQSKSEAYLFLKQLKILTVSIPVIIILSTAFHFYPSTICIGAERCDSLQKILPESYVLTKMLIYCGMGTLVVPVYILFNAYDLCFCKTVSTMTNFQFQNVGWFVTKIHSPQSTLV